MRVVYLQQRSSSAQRDAFARVAARACAGRGRARSVSGHDVQERAHENRQPAGRLAAFGSFAASRALLQARMLGWLAFSLNRFLPSFLLSFFLPPSTLAHSHLPQRTPSLTLSRRRLLLEHEAQPRLRAWSRWRKVPGLAIAAALGPRRKRRWLRYRPRQLRVASGG